MKSTGGTTITRMPSQSTVCSPNTTPRVLQWVHTSLSSGHPGIHCTTTLVRNAFYWPYINKDVVNFVKTCSVLKPLVSYLQVYYNHCQFHTIFGPPSPTSRRYSFVVWICLLNTIKLLVFGSHILSMSSHTASQ